MKEAWGRRSLLAATFVALTVAVGPGEASAGEVLQVPDYMDFGLIDGQVGAGVSGAIGINMTAGHSNLQANSGAIAIGEQAMAETNTTQAIGQGISSLPGRSTAAIRGGAFRNAKGWIGINQASGVANAQSNSVAVAVGGRGELVSSELAQVAASPPDVEADDGGGEGEPRTLVIGEEAFRKAEGVVQVNQSAGNGNATSNHVGLAVER